MRCFNHRDTTAIGNCRQCGKGLCPSCVADLGHGLACRGVHESAVEDIDALRARNRRNSRVARHVMSVFPAFLAVIGLVYILFGILYFKQDAAFTVILGIGFVALAIALFVINRRAIRARRAKSQSA